MNLPSDEALAITHREIRRLLDLYQPPTKQRVPTGTQRVRVAQRSAAAGVTSTDRRDHQKGARYMRAQLPDGTGRMNDPAPDGNPEQTNSAGGVS